jgi:hypothetical protein
MIYADENVWMPVARGLRRRGWEVTTAVEEETLGYSDAEHLRYAADQGWPLLTFDDDFLSLVDSELADVDHAGIVFVSQYGHTVGELVGRLDSTLQQHEERDISGEVVFA